MDPCYFKFTNPGRPHNVGAASDQVGSAPVFNIGGSLSRSAFERAFAVPHRSDNIRPPVQSKRAPCRRSGQISRGSPHPLTGRTHFIVISRYLFAVHTLPSSRPRLISALALSCACPYVCASAYLLLLPITSCRRRCRQQRPGTFQSHTDHMLSQA